MRPRSHLVLPLGGVLAAAMLLPAIAAANSAGQTGRSGKQGAICNECHSGGTAPTVSFEGPDTVVVGSMATFRFTVQSARTQQRAAGFNVAVSAGTLATGGDGERLVGGELTHSAPRANVDGAASWELIWTAPNAPGEATLFGAGNSVNLNSQSSGDRAAATTLTVMVIEAVTPSPTVTPLPLATDTPPPTATATRPAGPTDTPGGPCRGDCDGNHVVAVNELVTGVGIALGSTSAEACPALDSDGNGQVAISELIAAVASLLDGCP